MSAKVTIQLPDPQQSKELTFPRREGKLSFVELMQQLKTALAAPELPISQLYLTIDGVLWVPEVYATAKGEEFTYTAYPGSLLYTPPHFRRAYLGPPSLVITASAIDLELLETSKLVLDYYALLQIVTPGPEGGALFKIAVPSKVVQTMGVCLRDDGSYAYIWDLTFELDPSSYLPTRLAEACSWLFIESVVYNADGIMVPIREELANLETLAPACHALASLLQLTVPDEHRFLDAPLQHPVNEYHRLRRWNSTLSVARLQAQLTKIHSLPYSPSAKHHLTNYLLSLVSQCGLYELLAVRPPSWPYRNANSVEEDLFLSTAFLNQNTHARSCYLAAHPVVEEVAYLKSRCGTGYSLAGQTSFLRRLTQHLPVAAQLCSKGILLAGSFCTRLSVDQWYQLAADEPVKANLFVYGKNASKRYSRLENLILKLERLRVQYTLEYRIRKNLVEVSFWKLTPCQKEGKQLAPDFELQIVYTNAINKAQVLYNFDSSYLQCGYTEANFFASPEYYYFTSQRRSLILRSTIQLQRIVQMARRGFQPVLTQPRVRLLGTRPDLAPLYCDQETTLSFSYGHFMPARGKQLQIALTQHYPVTATRAEPLVRTSVHYLEEPVQDCEPVHVLHLLSSLEYSGLLLNSYNSYIGSRIERLDIRKNALYKKLVMPHDKSKLLTLEEGSSLLVSEFDVARYLDNTEKSLASKIKDKVIAKRAARLRAYHDSLITGPVYRVSSQLGEEYYRAPLTETELAHSHYLVTLDGVDTFPTLDEIKLFLAQGEDEVEPEIGLAYFDLNIRVGEKCHQGIRLDGTKVVHLPHEERLFLTEIATLEERVIQHLKKEHNLEAFLSNGVSLIVPVKVFYLKTRLVERYVGSDEQSQTSSSLDPDYTHTAVISPLFIADTLCFSIERVTKDLRRGVSVLQEIDEEENQDELAEHTSNESESETKQPAEKEVSSSQPRRVIIKTGSQDQHSESERSPMIRDDLSLSSREPSLALHTTAHSEIEDHNTKEEQREQEAGEEEQREEEQEQREEEQEAGEEEQREEEQREEEQREEEQREEEQREEEQREEEQREEEEEEVYLTHIRQEEAASDKIGDEVSEESNPFDLFHSVI